MTHPYASVSAALRIQGEFCTRSQAPLNGAILAKTANCLTGTDALSLTLQRVFAPWVSYSIDQLHDQATGLRWVGVWHYFALSRTSVALAQAYPSDANDWTSDPGAVWSIIVSMVDSHYDDIVRFMQYEPQTNETNRAIILLPGFLSLTSQFPSLPLHCLELGASAGLNTLWPKFHYRLSNDGIVTWGDNQSPVQLTTEWRGKPITASLSQALKPQSIVSVRGCDHSPFDLSDESQILRLRSYVWPDQRDRIQRQTAALTLAQRHSVTVECADAADWAVANVRLHPGHVTVLYHSFVWQYLPSESRNRIISHLHSVGAEATATSPLAWLTVEQRLHNGYTEGFDLKLMKWPGGEESVLAQCHPHGRWVELK